MEEDPLEFMEPNVIPKNKAKKKQKTVSLKEIKLRPGTDVHDYNFKIKNAKKFLSKKDKVKFTVKFKGREMQHIQLLSLIHI